MSNTRGIEKEKNEWIPVGRLVLQIARFRFARRICVLFGILAALIGGAALYTRVSNMDPKGRHELSIFIRCLCMAVTGVMMPKLFDSYVAVRGAKKGLKDYRDGKIRLSFYEEKYLTNLCVYFNLKLEDVRRRAKAQQRPEASSEA